MEITYIKKKQVGMMLGIILAIMPLNMLFSQTAAPGGLTNVTTELWLQADKVQSPSALPADDALVSQWKDISGNNRHAEQATAGNQPKFNRKNLMNFQPSLNFGWNGTGSSTVSRLLTTGSYIPSDNTKSYYVFYVSRIDAARTAASSVFSFQTGSGSANNVNFHGWTSFNPYYTSQGTGNATTFDQGGVVAQRKKYGIVGALRPNNGTPGQIYFNGESATGTSNNNAMTAAAAPSAIGTANQAYGTAFVGDIQEIIVMTGTPAGQVLNAVEVQKINTYLAIKYGLTISGDYYGSDYEITSNNPVWSRTANNGYNEFIFGIGHDSNSGLYQKQSASYENNLYTISTGDLTDLNAENQSLLPDGYYLMLGYNDGKGVNVPFSYNAGENFSEGTSLTSKTSRRSNTVLRSQVTNKFGNVENINLNITVAYRNVTHILVSTDGDFDNKATTRVYPVDENGVAKNVRINDEEYISFAVYNVSAGDVSAETELWLKADELSTNLPSANNAFVARWLDKSGKGRDARQDDASGSYQPQYKNSDLMNFNPAVTFTNNNNRFVTSGEKIKTDPSKSYYVFYVSRLAGTNNTGARAVYSFNQTTATTNSNVHGWYNTDPYFSNNTRTDANNLSIFASSSKNYGIIGAVRPNNGSKGILYFNGARKEATNSNTPAMPELEDYSVIGSSNNGAYEPFWGDLQELIVMSDSPNKNMDEEEVQKINTYLALKYGLTLEDGDYLGSSGISVPVWTRNANTGYEKNIFGIGFDEKTGLNQKQSRSYEDNTFTVFIDDLYDLNVDNKGSIPNGEYLVFGSNGDAGTVAYSYSRGDIFAEGTSLTANTSHRSHTVLKAQRTGDFSVNMKITYVNATHVLVSDNISFSQGSTRAYGLDDNGIARDVVIRDGEYVTFTVFNVVPGGANDADTEIWFKADELMPSIPLDNAAISKWQDVSGKGNDAIQNTVASRPVFKRESPMNFNPRVQFSIAAHNVQSAGNYKFLANKSYYIFYVSSLNTTSNGTYTVFSTSTVYSTGGNTNDQGWQRATATGNRPYYTTNGTTANAIYYESPGFNYGIVGVIRPNISGTNGQIYYNGTSNNGSNALMADSESPFVIGSTSATTANGFIGDIHEVIVLSSDNKHVLSTIDAAKVNTYLALKYGITLTAGDYLPAEYTGNAGSNTPVWTRSSNGIYVKNIFGIGRDEHSGLYQKQSASVESDLYTVFVGDKIAHLNLNNKGTIPEESYIVFGSNGDKGVTTAYQYMAGTSFDGGTSLSDNVSHRSNTVLKTQRFGTDFNVNMKVYYMGANYLLVSSSPTFEPSATRVYKLDKDGIAYDVKMNSGEYVCFAISNPNPGGIVGNGMEMEAWYKADQMLPQLPSDKVTVSRWMDASGNVRHADQNTDADKPIFNSSRMMNYQPAVEFLATRNRLITTTGDIKRDANKSYYVFYVSRFDNASVSPMAVFSFRTDDANNHGWYDGDPYFTTNGTATGNRTVYTRTAPKKLYGIVGGIRPNNGTAGQIYYNGVAYAGTNTLAMTDSGTGNAVLGSQNDGTTAGFIGDVQEIIVLSTNNRGLIDPLDAQKLNTYLAVKYGLTLDGDVNYILSDGTVIWQKGFYSGYDNGIFGIGKHYSSSINQKQSTSFDDPVITVFLDDFKNLNVDNTAELPEGQFVMFGNNNLKTLSSYVYPSETAYANGNSLSLNSSNIRDLKLRAHLTNIPGNSITLNMKTHIPAHYIVVSQDPNFDPAYSGSANGTRLYSVDKGNVENVLIEEGDYIGFVLAEMAPGGVTGNLRVWLRADDPASIVRNGTDVSLWYDQTPYGNDYSYKDVDYGSKTYPQYLDCSYNMNFHPTVEFSETSYLASAIGNFSADAPDDYTSFTAYFSTREASGAYYYTHGHGSLDPRSSASRRPAIGFSPSARRARLRYNSDQYFNGNVSAYRERTTSLQMLYMRKVGAASGSTKTIFDFGGWQETLTPSSPVGDGSYSATNFGQNVHLQLGGTLGGASIASGSFVGLISEFFIYERELSDYEQDRVRTYIGMKYAITLDADGDDVHNNYDYRLSDKTQVLDGTTVWKGNSTPNKWYHNNVAGLVRDDRSIFLNKSRSSADQACVTMMVAGHQECGQGNTSGLRNDLSGIFWGNNGATQIADFSQMEECVEYDVLLQRIWTVQKTNIDYDQAVTIRLGQGFSGYNSFINHGYEAFLLIADDSLSLTTGEWRAAIPGVFVDGEHQFEYTFNGKSGDDVEYEYFTFAFVSTGSNCEACNFRGKDYLAFDRKNIGRNLTITPSRNNPFERRLITENGNLEVDVNFEIQTGVTRMRVVTPPNKTRPVNLQSWGASGAISQVKYRLERPANFSFSIADIDQREEAIVYGICEGIEVKPSYVYPAVLTRRSEIRRGHTYAINTSGSRVSMLANGQQSAGRRNNRGRVNIDFGFSVEEVVIEFTHHRPTLRFLDLWDMAFSCPQPLPMPNEAGFAFQKQGPDKVHVCEVVDYSFVLLNANGNCDSTRVVFEDILEDGMFWVPGSLTVDNNLIDTTAVGINEDNIFMEDNVLRIKGLILPGNGTRTLVKAQAAFKEGAVVGRDYKNQGNITYIRKDTGDPEKLLSTDAFFMGSPSDPDEDKKTVTFVLNEERDFKYASIEMSTRPSCYKENNEVQVTLAIQNPNNKAVNKMILDTYYNENFKFKKGSLRINGNVPSSSVKQYIEEDEEGEELPGTSYFEGFTLAANSTTVITYIVKAPPLSDLNYEEVDGKKIYENLVIDYDLTTEDEGGVCMQNAFLNTFGNAELPYCEGRSYIISNRQVTSKIRKW